jgi:carbamoylphosphate synthase small subunit
VVSLARPKKEIDLKQVESLAALQCTDEEIAAVLGVDVRTITRKKSQKHSGFVQAYKRGKEKGKTSLRRQQWKAAQGTNYIAYRCDKKQAISTEYICDQKKAAKKDKLCVGCPGATEVMTTIFKAGATGMQIWLGKQWLGQAEKQEITGKDGGPLTTENVNKGVVANLDAKESAKLYAQMIKNGK